MAERYADVRLKLSHRNVLHIENQKKCEIFGKRKLTKEMQIAEMQEVAAIREYDDLGMEDGDRKSEGWRGQKWQMTASMVSIIARGRAIWVPPGACWDPTLGLQASPVFPAGTQSILETVIT